MTRTERSVILATNTGSINGTSVGGTLTNAIVASDTVGISNTGGNSQMNSIISGTQDNIITVTGSTNSNTILASRVATIQGDTGFNICNGIICSTSSTIKNSTGGNCQVNVILGSNQVNIDNSVAGVINGNNAYAGCRFLTSNGSQNSFFGGSNTVTVTSVSPLPTELGSLACASCTFNGASGQIRRSAFLACSSGTITGPVNNALLIGIGSSCTGFNGVFAMSAAATASNQAIFGVRIDQTGTTNNFTTQGYAYADRGFVDTRGSQTTNYTLTVSDGHLRIATTTSRLITIPTAAAMGANYPLNTVKSWVISAPETSTPSRLLLSGSDVFNQITGLQSVYLPKTGSPLTLTLQNSASPFWSLGPVIEQTAVFSTATANNFGTAPPAANASLLTTSANAAAHQALGAASYVTLNVTDIQNPQVFTSAPSNLGWVTTALGYSDIVITFTLAHTTATVGAPFLIRCDILNGVSSTSLGSSYFEFAGTNDVSGSGTYQYTVPNVRCPVGTFRLRISQDSTYGVTTAASLTSARVEIVTRF